MTLTTERAGARAQLECDCWERWTNSHSHLFYYEFLRETEWKRMDRWHKQVGCVPHRKLNSSVCNRYAFRILFIGRFHSHTVRVCGFVSVALVCLAIARWPAFEPVSSGFESEIQLNAFGTIAGRTVSVGLTVYSKWSGRNALMCAGIKLYFMCAFNFQNSKQLGKQKLRKSLQIVLPLFSHVEWFATPFVEQNYERKITDEIAIECCLSLSIECTQFRPTIVSNFRENFNSAAWPFALQPAQVTGVKNGLPNGKHSTQITVWYAPLAHCCALKLNYGGKVLQGDYALALSLIKAAPIRSAIYFNISLNL